MKLPIHHGRGPALLAAGVAFSIGTAAVAQDAPASDSALFAEMPLTMNTLDGISMAPDGTLVLSVPNFNNIHLADFPVKHGASPALMAGVSADGRVSPWYRFADDELHPDTVAVGPMAHAFGPDGNLYVNDMQVYYDRGHKSRVLRIVMEDGEPQRSEVVVTGLIAANGMDWHGDTMFVTESILKDPKAEGNASDRLLSGVYAFTLDELNGAPVEVAPYGGDGDVAAGDPHLVEVYESSNRAGFGADGVAVGGDGALYVGVLEAATIHRTELDGIEAVSTDVFVQGEPIDSTDGLIWSDARDAFFLADFFGNKVHRISPEGEVTVLAENGDTSGADGGLDMPAVVFERADDLIVANMDMAWAAPTALRVNRDVDGAYQLVRIPLTED